eukprot:12225268-Prorocentrum_lima.AAC.1
MLRLSIRPIPSRQQSTRPRSFAASLGCHHCSRIQICSCCGVGRCHRGGMLPESISGRPT